MGKFRHDQKPSFTLYSSDAAGTVLSNVKILNVSFHSASRPVYIITNFERPIVILKPSISVKASDVARSHYRNISVILITQNILRETKHCRNYR